MIRVKWDSSIRSEVERAKKVFTQKQRNGQVLYSPTREKLQEFDEKLQYFTYVVPQADSRDEYQ